MFSKHMTCLSLLVDNSNTSPLDEELPLYNYKILLTSLLSWRVEVISSHKIPQESFGLLKNVSQNSII